MMTDVNIHALEAFFLTLMVLVTLTVGWFSVYVVYRLFKREQ